MGKGLALLVFAATLAGCAIPSEQEVGSIEPGTDRFTLTVEVLDGILGGRPIEGVDVSAGNAEGNTTSGVTDAFGMVRLHLLAPQVISVEATSPGRAGAATSAIHLGDASSLVVGDIFGALACGFTLGLACPVDVTTRLPGTEGRVRLYLLPTSVTREVNISVAPSASSPVSRSGMLVDVPYTGDPDLDVLYGQQARRIEGTLQWTNAPGTAADLEFVLACGMTEAETNAGSPVALAPGERTLTLGMDGAGDCIPLSTGVWVDSVSTEVNARATIVIAMGPGIQRPR